jgi:hypothetical protein
MKTMQSLKLLVSAAMFMLVGMFAQAGTLTANFTTNWNYLVNGVQGPLFDGFYKGNSDINYTGIAANQGNTTTADQNITSNGVLQINSVNTDFGDTANDDGVFIYKVVSNDFSVITHIAPPFPNGAFNEGGLQARRFGVGGGAAGGSENWVGLFRFDQFGFGHIIRNAVNGGNAGGVNPDGTSLTNTNSYWTRMDRVTLTNFQFFQSSNGVDWLEMTATSGNATNRADFNNVPVQVGLHHSTFNDSAAGAPNLVRYDAFNISSVDFDAYAPMPGPVTGFKAVTNGGQNIDLSWTNAAGGTNALIVVYSGTTGTNATNWVRYAPSSGVGYAADNRYGLGSSLLTSNENFVVFSAAGSSMTVSNLVGGTSYRAVIYAYNGDGAAANYNHLSSTVTFTSTATPTSLVATAPNAPVVAGSGRPIVVLLNFSNGSQKDVRASSTTASITNTTTYTSSDPTVGNVPVGGRLSIYKPGTINIAITNVWISGAVSNTNSTSIGPITVIAGNITHRYSFSEATTDGGGNVTTNFSDSVGTANGTIVNAHTDIPAITWPGNGTLTFDSAISTYAQLPADLFTNQGGSTFEVWFNADPTAANAARIIDAGSSTGSSLFLNNNITGSMAAGAGATTVNATRPTGGNHHIVFVQDGAFRFYTLYVDGLRVGATTAANTTPENVGAEPNIFLGRSQTGNFNLGAIDELRTYNYPLDALTIATHFVNGTSVTNNSPGTASALSISFTSPMTQDDTAQATVLGTFSLVGSMDVTFTTNIVYSSSNTNIASVSTNGVVSAVSPGVATITVVGFSLTNSQSVTVLPVIPIMQHRWSFNLGNGDLSDSIGGATGSPNNVTWVTRVLPNGVTNNEVVLTPTGFTAKTSYVLFPPNLLSSQSSLTFEMWYTERFRRNWARIWDFGNNTGRYLFMTPFAPSGAAANTGNPAANDTRAAILVPGSTPANEQQINAFRVQPGVEHHIVYTLDGINKVSKIYMDGVFVAQNTNTTDRPRDIGPTQFDYMGASQFGDPDFDGYINEFRQYNYAISAFQVVLNDTGADAAFVSETNLGTLSSVTVTANTMNAGTQQQARALATWSLATNLNVTQLASNWVSSSPGVIHVDASGNLTALSAGSATISATFSNVTGTSSAITVNAAVAPVLGHRWSFNGDLTDSIGGANGSNGGTAVVTGGALVLSGASNSWVRLPGHLFDTYNDATFEWWASTIQTSGITNVSNTRILDFGSDGLINTPVTNNWFSFSLHGAGISGTTFRWALNPGGAQNQHTYLSQATLVYSLAVTNHYLWTLSSTLGQAKIYVNGRLFDIYNINGSSFAVGPSIPSSLTNDVGYIGHGISLNAANQPNFSNFFGNISEVRIWNGAMDSVQAQTSAQLGPDAANPLDPGALNSISTVLNDSTMVLNTLQRPVVTAQYANVSNINLTSYPGVSFASSDTTKVTVVVDADGAQRLKAVGAGSASIVTSFGGKSATNAVTVITQPALQLTHRWKFFNNSAADVIGNATATLIGEASFTNNGLNLTGNKIPTTYADLGADLISGYDKVTFEAFSDNRANGAWANIFGFGERDQNGDNALQGVDYIFATHGNGGGVPQVTTRPNSVAPTFIGVESTIVGTGGNLYTNNNVHFVMTVDSTSNVQTLYTNGVQAAKGTNVNNNVLGINNRQSILGRSFFNDPNLNANIKEFRIWYGIMDSNQVLSSYNGAYPKVSAVDTGAGSVLVSWPDGTPFTDGWTLQRTLSLTPTSWSNVGIAQVTNAGKVSVTVPEGATNTAYFRLAK